MTDKIKFMHVRMADDFSGVYNSGGFTLAFTGGKDGADYNIAVAVCSVNDNFCRATGRDIASKRLAAGKVITKDQAELYNMLTSCIERPRGVTVEPEAFDGWVRDWLLERLQKAA